MLSLGGLGRRGTGGSAAGEEGRGEVPSVDWIIRMSSVSKDKSMLRRVAGAVLGASCREGDASTWGVAWWTGERRAATEERRRAEETVDEGDEAESKGKAAEGAEEKD